MIYCLQCKVDMGGCCTVFFDFYSFRSAFWYEPGFEMSS